MPFALIFTSAPRGLTSPRSGYVTVARHRDIPDRLVEQLEQLGTPHEQVGTATFTARTLDAGGKRWMVLSRFTAGGLDHTQRDNRLAHHLIFSPDELTRLPPLADIALRTRAWLDRWEGEPAWLEPESLPLARAQPLLPCTRWRERTGSGAKAAWLVSEAGATPRSLSGNLTSEDWLGLLAEASALLGPGATLVSFTTNASVTGNREFTWRCQNTGGELNLAAPENIPLPEGTVARLAAVGVSKPNQPVHPVHPTTTNAPKPQVSLSGNILGGIAVLIVIALGLVIYLARPSQPKAELPSAPPRAPRQEDSAATRRILNEQAALAEINGAIASRNFDQAGRLWIELERVSPDFASRHQDPALARIRSGFAQSVTERLAGRLDLSEVATSNRRTYEVMQEAKALVILGTSLQVPRDTAWNRLEQVASRAAFLHDLDVQPTYVIRGNWNTAGAGPKVALHAEFNIGEEAGKVVQAFLTEATLAEKGTGSLAYGPFSKLGDADRSQRPEPAVIEIGHSSVWIASTARSAGNQASIEVNVGKRVNAVTLRLPPTEAANLEGPIAIRLNNNRSRMTLVLLPPDTQLQPLRLPAGALRREAQTEAIAAAGWIEPLLNNARVAGLRLGLYPAGHPFPDRTIPSLLSPPNQLKVTLLSLLAGQGDMPRAEVLKRQALASEGAPLQAGSPWTLRAINVHGEPVMTLAEFDER